MDPQTMVIGAAIFVVSAIVIYLISVCSMREKTFEEVLEEQRRHQAEELKKQKVEKKDKVRKRYPGRKGKKDKVEEKSTSAATTPLIDSESDTDRVIEPEVIEPQVVEPVHQQKQEKKKKEKKKPKEEVAVVHEEDLYEPLVKEPVEEVMIEAQKAVEVEAPAREQSHKEKKSKRAHKEEQIEEQIIVQEEVRVQEVAPLKSEPPQVEIKKSKKKATESGAGDNVDGSYGLIQMVRSANLTETEVMQLVEVLQTKQGAALAQWTKKSKQADATAVLKKQLEEKERSLVEEHQAAQNAAQKLRDLRGDLSRERQRYETLERQLGDKMKAQDQEKDALLARMQQTHDQHVAEVTGLRRQLEVAKLSQDQAGLVQRLTEENQKLKEAASQAQAAARRENNDKQALKMMQEELSKNVVKLNASTNTNKQLEAQLSHYKEQLQKMESTQHEVVSRKLSDMTEELRRSEARNTSVAKDLELARSNASRFEQELANVHNRMKDLQAQESHSRQLEQQLQDTMHAKKTLESRLGEVEHANKTTDSQLRQLREENNLLAAQLKESKERTAGEGQEAPAAEVNGEVSAPAKADAETTKLLNEREEEISNLKSELQAKVQETSKLSGDLEAQKQKNNELVSKQEALVVELTQKSSKDSDEQLTKVSQLEEELSTKTEQLKELDTLREQLAELTEQQKTIESYKIELTQRDEKLKTVDDLKKQLEAQTSELSAYSELKKDIVAKEDEIKQLSELKKELEGKEEQLREALGTELKNKESELVSLTEELNKLKEQNQDLQKNTDSQAVQLSTELDTVKSDLNNKTSEVSSLQQKVQDLEGSLDKLTKEAGQAADADRVTAELEATNSQLQKITKELEEVRVENQALQEQAVVKTEAPVLASPPPQTESTTTLKDVTILTRVEEKSTFDVSQLLSDLDARDVELSILQNVLAQKEAENRKFKGQLEEVNSLHREVNERTLEVTNLTQQLNLQKQKTHEMQQQMAQGQTAGHVPTPNDDAAFLKEELTVKKEEIANLRDIVKSYWTENNELKEKLEALEDAQENTVGTGSGVDQEKVALLEQELGTVRQELDDRTVKVASLEESNSKLEKNNSQLNLQAKELQEKNQSILEELQNSKQQAQAKSSQQDLKNELQTTQKVIHNIFPDVSVSDTENYSEWLSTFEKQAKQYLLSCSTQENGIDSRELEESQQAQSRLQAQVQHYKDVLADTEGILNKLQSSVEEEEKKWRHRVTSAEERNTQLDQELKGLKEQLSTIEEDKLDLQSKISEGLANGSSRPQEIEQLKTNLAQTQRQLEREVQVNRQLTQRLGAGAESIEDGTSV